MDKLNKIGLTALAGVLSAATAQAADVSVSGGAGFTYATSDTTEVTGNVILPAGTEMVMAGDNVDLEIELITPIAMEKELRFAIREGGHTVGAGVVTEIND